jgi:hypothetical protein
LLFDIKFAAIDHAKRDRPQELGEKNEDEKLPGGV